MARLGCTKDDARLGAAGRVVLFTDFDGVVHPRPTAGRDAGLFCSIHLLEDVLRHVPNVQVVISSSWREHHPLEEMREYFAEDLRERIVGVTPMLRRELESIPESLLPYPRHAECIAWLHRERAPGTCWLALDDSPEEFVPGCTHLIPVDGSEGLTRFVAGMLLQRLRSSIAVCGA
jgi:hypothetical protein